MVGCSAVENTEGDLHTDTKTLVTCYDDRLLTILEHISASHIFSPFRVGGRGDDGDGDDDDDGGGGGDDDDGDGDACAISKT